MDWKKIGKKISDNIRTLVYVILAAGIIALLIWGLSKTGSGIQKAILSILIGWIVIMMMIILWPKKSKEDKEKKKKSTEITVDTSSGGTTKTTKVVTVESRIKRFGTGIKNNWKWVMGLVGVIAILLFLIFLLPELWNSTTQSVQALANQAPGKKALSGPWYLFGYPEVTAKVVIGYLLVLGLGLAFIWLIFKVIGKDFILKLVGIGAAIYVIFFVTTCLRDVTTTSPMFQPLMGTVQPGSGTGDLLERGRLIKTVTIEPGKATSVMMADWSTCVEWPEKEGQRIYKFRPKDGKPVYDSDGTLIVDEGRVNAIEIGKPNITDVPPQERSGIRFYWTTSSVPVILEIRSKGT